MASKRKKTKFCFSPEAIQKELEFESRVTDFKRSLSLTAIANLEHDTKLALSSLMFGFDTVTCAIFAIKHIPEAFRKYKNMRMDCIISIVKAMCPENKVSHDDLQNLVVFLEELAPAANVSLANSDKYINETLLKLSGQEKWNFCSFICLPVAECLTCDGFLVAANPPSLCLEYTPTGPKPATKITLKCKDCAVFYGCNMYSSDGVSHYYSTGKVISLCLCIM